MNATPACRTCGDARTHHLAATECWGPGCKEKPRAERCHSFQQGATTYGTTAQAPSPEKPPTPPKRPPRTDLAADKVDDTEGAPFVPPREGTAKRDVFDLVADAGSRGMTDGELAAAADKRKPATLTKARAALVAEGAIRDSGMRRADGARDTVVWTSNVHDGPAADTNSAGGGLFQEDVTVTLEGGYVTVSLHEAATLRFSPAPGDPVEIAVRTESDDESAGPEEVGRDGWRRMFVATDVTPTLYDDLRHPEASPEAPNVVIERLLSSVDAVLDDLRKLL